MIKYLEKEIDFQKEIEKDDVLVDFYADWCGPCRMQSDILLELDKQKNVNILKVNIDKFPDLASKYQITSIPTLLFFQNNNIKNKEIGVRNLEELLELTK